MPTQQIVRISNSTVTSHCSLWTITLKPLLGILGVWSEPGMTINGGVGQRVKVAKLKLTY